MAPLALFIAHSPRPPPMLPGMFVHDCYAIADLNARSMLRMVRCFQHLPDIPDRRNETCSSAALPAYQHARQLRTHRTAVA